MTTENHTASEIAILQKFKKRVKKERFVNNQASIYYGKLNTKFIIPSILITGFSSVASFLSSSDFFGEDGKAAFGIGVGVLTAGATIFQSLSSSYGFQVKHDSFQRAADAYDRLITKIDFEIYNPNEKFSEFCEELEADILKIKNDCKYLPPLSIYQMYKKHITEGLTNDSNSDTSSNHDYNQQNVVLNIENLSSFLEQMKQEDNKEEVKEVKEVKEEVKQEEETSEETPEETPEEILEETPEETSEETSEETQEEKSHDCRNDDVGHRETRDIIELLQNISEDKNNDNLGNESNV